MYNLYVKQKKHFIISRICINGLYNGSDGGVMLILFISERRSDIGCDMLMSKFYLENMYYYEKIHNGSF